MDNTLSIQRVCKSCSSSKIVVDGHQCVCEECGVILEDQVTAIVPFTGYSDEHDPCDSRVFIPIASRYECDITTASDRVDARNGSPSKHRSAEDVFQRNNSSASCSGAKTTVRHSLPQRHTRKRISTTEQQIEALVNSCIKRLQLGEKVRQLALNYFREVRRHPSVSNSIGELQAAYAIACVSCASRAAKTPVTFASLRTYLETAKQVHSFKRIIEKTKRLLWSDNDKDKTSGNGTTADLCKSQPQTTESPFALQSNDVFENLAERARLSKAIRERAREIWSLVRLTLQRSFSPELSIVISMYLADVEATARYKATWKTTANRETTKRSDSSSQICSLANLNRFISDRLELGLGVSQVRNCFTQLTDRLFEAVRTQLPTMLPMDDRNDSNCTTVEKAEFTRRLHLHIGDLCSFRNVLFNDLHTDATLEADVDIIECSAHWSAPPHRSVLDPSENEHDVPITQFDTELDTYIRSPQPRSIGTGTGESTSESESESCSTDVMSSS